MSQKKFEQYRWFPAIAWTLCIGFTLFVLNMAFELRDTADDLRETSISLEQRMRSVEQTFDQTPDHE